MPMSNVSNMGTTPATSFRRATTSAPLTLLLHDNIVTASGEANRFERFRMAQHLGVARAGVVVSPSPTPNTTQQQGNGIAFGVSSAYAHAHSEVARTALTSATHRTCPLVLPIARLAMADTATRANLNRSAPVCGGWSPFPRDTSARMSKPPYRMTPAATAPSTQEWTARHTCVHTPMQPCNQDMHVVGGRYRHNARSGAR